MTNVAFLVYRGTYKQGKRSRSDFDGQDNIGAYVIKDALERASQPVAFCSPETAHHHDIVLVLLTSLYDVLNFIQSVGQLSTWQKDKRRFRSVIGGAGLQNVSPLREYIDYAVFGRAEDFVVDLIRCIAASRDYHHESVMCLREGITPVRYAQATRLYPYEIDVGTGKFQETVSGCPMKCAFCHYTYARKWMGGNAQEYIRDGSYQSSEPGGKVHNQGNKSGSGAEGLFKQSIGLLGENPQSRIITGLDGLSQRLRYAFRKRISNDKVKEIFEMASHASIVDPAYYKLYMIGSYPSETEADYLEFLDVMQSVSLGGKNRVHVAVHLTPFQASPLSPAAWMPVRFDIDWRTKIAGKDIARGEKYKAWFSRYIETEWTHLQVMIVARATEDTDEIINQLCFNSKLRGLGAQASFDALTHRYDVAQFRREYMIDERLPTWYLRSYVPDGVLERAAVALKKTLGLDADPATKTEGKPELVQSIELA